jgi:hypothetical protein
MTKVGKTLAVISLLCADISGAVAAQAVSQQASATCLAETEKAKWAALRMVLTEKIEASKSFVNKVGAAMDRYAPLLAGIVGMVVLGACSYSVKRAALMEALVPIAVLMGASEQQPSSCQQGKMPPAADVSAKKCLPCFYVRSFLLPATLTYVLCKPCGAYLESTSSRCLDVVTEIAGAWTTYKEYMPSVLCPQFEGYAQDLKKNGTLTTIDKNGARQLIEAILAMSLIVEAAK